MFDKKQVQKAIKEIDDNLASLNGPRQAHITLTSDVNLIQAVCMDYFEQREGAKAAPEKKDERTNIIPINTKPGSKNS